VADPAVEVIGEAEDAGTALQRLQAGSCDLVLLDIRMPGRDGMQLAAALRALPQPPSVVFVTAHGSHALRAFELDAVDYLTKPVRRDRLQAALQRVVQRRWPNESQPAPLADEPMLVVHDRGRVRRIPVAEVLVLKAELKYVTLRTAQGSHLLDDSLTDLERRLGDGFIRIHRNALLALAFLDGLELVSPGQYQVRMKGIDERLVVSRRHLPELRETMLKL